MKDITFNLGVGIVVVRPGLARIGLHFANKDITCNERYLALGTRPYE